MSQITLDARAINGDDVYFCICGVDHAKKTLFFHLILESDPSGDISVLHLGARRFEYLTDFPKFIDKVKKQVKEMDLDVEIDFDSLSPLMDDLRAESVDLIRSVMEGRGNPTADVFNENKKTKHGLSHSGGKVCYLEGRWGIRCDNEVKFTNAHSISESNNLLPLDDSEKFVFSCWPKNGEFVSHKSSSKNFSASKYICRNHEIATWEIEREGGVIDINSKNKVLIAIDRTIAYVSFLIDKRKNTELKHAREFSDSFLYFTDSGGLRLDGCDVRSFRGEIEYRQLSKAKHSIDSFLLSKKERLIFSIPLRVDPPVMCNNLVFFDEGFIFLSVLRNGRDPIAIMEFSSSELLFKTLDREIIYDCKLFANLFTFLMMNARPFFVNTRDAERFEMSQKFLDISQDILNSIQVSRTGISIIEGVLIGRVRACDAIKQFEDGGHTRSSTLYFNDTQTCSLKTKELFKGISESELISDIVEFLQPEGLIPHQEDLKKLSYLIMTKVGI